MNIERTLFYYFIIGYQPLDRKIFGIIKKQLTQQEMHSPIGSAILKEQYPIVHEKLLKLWENISTSAINSAWDIDGLELEPLDN